MIKEDKKLVVEGKMIGMHETLGWCVQEPPDVNRPYDRGLRNGATMFQAFIGKTVRVTVEVVE
jgi:hypothetical protein